MSQFINEDFLLQGKTAKSLYHQHASKMPIIDYHNHLDAKDIYNDIQYRSMTDAWLSGDHYLWRALRSNGVDEHFITGDAPKYEKFQKWCETMPYLLGNPLYHWCHLELKTYFGLDIRINSENCAKIWKHCNAQLKSSSHSLRQLLLSSHVETLCTTDDPLSDLSYHRKLAESDFSVQVLPTFRADSLFAIDDAEKFHQMLTKLSVLTNIAVNDFTSYAEAIIERVRYFSEHQCRLSDVGLKVVNYAPSSAAVLDQIIRKLLLQEPLSALEVAQFKTAVFKVLGEAYYAHGWSMQVHIGVLTNVNRRRLNELGKGTGFSVINDNAIATNLCHLLSMLDEQRRLPQTILYSINPKDSVVLGSILGAFQDSDSVPGKIQLGSAWWFNDHKAGMEKQLQDLANLGALGRFIGMLTDSRSVLSFSRHDYFRRILCNLIGHWVDTGELPKDKALLSQTVENICYWNAKNYFNFNVLKN
ncbi:glucuronate isomerase [Psychromonas sp. RZ22]|uniref:glucuronate isomerase n=1 Tax=Psychromonas algarum TaxID=2555643 RepID=UPI001067475E|nr:glucuronate isomerase [Psychromonas sp. RZ22]TEW54664.1 glucuronate isomerase [Psychromonas sp. RZ22]